MSQGPRLRPLPECALGPHMSDMLKDLDLAGDTVLRLLHRISQGDMVAVIDLPEAMRREQELHTHVKALMAVASVAEEVARDGQLTTSHQLALESALRRAGLW